MNKLIAITLILAVTLACAWGLSHSDEAEAATGAYTDGDWTFDVSGSNATIVSNTATGITALNIPSTVTANGNTYTVTTVGKGGSTVSYAIVQNSQLSTNGCTLTIPSGVTSIASYAFSNCSGFTGSLTIPSGVTIIGLSAFTNCSGFTGSLTIPSSVTNIDNYSFQNCSGFTGSLTIPSGVTRIGGYAFNDCSGFTGSLTIPSSVTTVANSTFNNCSGFDSMINLSGSTFGTNSLNMVGVKEVLNLGTTELNPGSYGLPTNCVVRSDIDASMYVAPVSISETTQKTGATYDILGILPLIMVLGALMVGVYAIGRKYA